MRLPLPVPLINEADLHVAAVVALTLAVLSGTTKPIAVYPGSLRDNAGMARDSLASEIAATYRTNDRHNRTDGPPPEGCCAAGFRTG